MLQLLRLFIHLLKIYIHVKICFNLTIARPILLLLSAYSDQIFQVQDCIREILS